MVKKIYFDMDGVLADFDTGVREYCGMEPSSQGSDWKPGDDDLMWEKIRGVEHFYDKLKILPGAKEMFDCVYEKYGENCQILTGIPKPKRGIVTAGEDKVAWAHRLLSEELVVNIVFREQKPDYCSGKDCILIDDLEANIAEWEKNGGTGILHKSSEETIRILTEMGAL